MINPFIRTGLQLSKNFVVDINTSLPYIAINEVGNEEHSVFFAQGEDAQNILNEVPNNLNPKQYILGYLDSAGLFNQPE
jgi:hypothetical protein